MKKIIFLIGGILIVSLAIGQLKKQNSGNLPLAQSDIMLVNAKNDDEEIKELVEGSFILNGKVVGQDNGYVYLTYTDKEGKQRKDSCRIKNFSFRFEGNIQHPRMAYIYGNVKSRAMDDPNFTGFFLEPAVMTFVTKINDFKNAQITGSKTQDEYAALNRSKEVIRKQMKPALNEYEVATKKYMDAVKKKQDEKTLEQLKEKAYIVRDKFTPYNERMKKIDYQFFSSHPQSYVTAYMLRFHVSGLSLDSLQMFYDRLGEKLQQTVFGKYLHKEIEELRSGAPGSIAKDFSVKDINGNELRLADFKGKYVLLDFWASWCVPCRKGNPHLKTLYAKYKDKGIEFIGIASDDSSPDAWRKAVEKDGLPWRHVLSGFDRKKQMKNEPNENHISEKYGIHTLPTKILIAPDGRIIGRYGEEEDELDKKLAEILS